MDEKKEKKGFFKNLKGNLKKAAFVLGIGASAVSFNSSAEAHNSDYQANQNVNNNIKSTAEMKNEFESKIKVNLSEQTASVEETSKDDDVASREEVVEYFKNHKGEKVTDPRIIKGFQKMRHEDLLRKARQNNNDMER